MEINDIIAALTEGLPADQAAIVKAAIERDSVKAKATSWKQQSEYDTLQAQATQLKQSYDNTVPYATWYSENYAKIEALQKRQKAYEDKFGQLETAPVTQPPAAQAMTAEQIQAEVDKRIREQYSPRWSSVVTTTGTILQKHLLRGRKTEIDFDKLAQEANTKYQGDLSRAYEEWDKPEAEKEVKAKQDAEVERRVKEEVAKRSSAGNFPARESQEPGSLSTRAKTEVDGFDKSALTRELVNTFVGAGNDSVQ